MRHCSATTLGGSTEHFTTNDGVGAYKNIVSENAVREFRNSYSNHDNAGLMMWVTAQDTSQKNNGQQHRL